MYCVKCTNGQYIRECQYTSSYPDQIEPVFAVFEYDLSEDNQNFRQKNTAI